MTSNILWTSNATDNAANVKGYGRAYTGAAEDVLCWDVKKGELISRWHANDCSHEVTVIACCEAISDLFAVG